LNIQTHVFSNYVGINLPKLAKNHLPVELKIENTLSMKCSYSITNRKTRKEANFGKPKLVYPCSYIY